MKLHFTIQECCATDEPVPQRIADAIMRHHIIPQSFIRDKLGAPIYVNGSCWRSKEYERAKGRDPVSSSRTKWSDHTFLIDEHSAGWGAFDGHTHWHLMHIYADLLLSSPYSRIAFYPDQKFIHSDYRFFNQGKRLYIATDSGWEQRPESEWLNEINKRVRNS